MITVLLGLALVCFDGECHPALVGSRTPTGIYEPTIRLVEDPLYGGSVLQFHETETEVYAFHKIWNGKPSERREWAIRQSDPKIRTLTNGCINLEPSVYLRMLSCCANQTIRIGR